MYLISLKISWATVRLCSSFSDVRVLVLMSSKMFRPRMRQEVSTQLCTHIYQNITFAAIFYIIFF